MGYGVKRANKLQTRSKTLVRSSACWQNRRRSSPTRNRSLGGHSSHQSDWQLHYVAVRIRPFSGGLFLCLCLSNIKRIIAVMVIQMEYGYEENTPIKTQIKRGVLRHQLSHITESFFQQEQYRWGRMYSLVGKQKTLIRQF